MKKFVATALAVIIMSISLSSFCSASGVNYEQPFTPGTCGSETFRIPAIITLNDGSVMAAADMRYEHGSDSPNNIDTLIAVSKNGLTDWKYNCINHFNDCADGATDTSSASFIDSALIQSKESNRIFIITDAFPSGMGYNQAQKGSGFVKSSDGTMRLALTTVSDGCSLKSYDCFVGSFNNGFAPICCPCGNTKYSVDEEYNLYQNGQPIYTQQKNSQEETQQNIFYSNSYFHVFPTSYLWLRYSDDGGQTWSHPQILNSQVKSEKEKFLGISPGRGFITKCSGKERIIFTVYNNKGLSEHASTIYSDDNGTTWNRGKDVSARPALGKTSESQIVVFPNGTLNMFARNSSDYISSCTSLDGGVSWQIKAFANSELEGNANCMVSCINYSKKINGQNVILLSFPSDTSTRADGVIKIGFIETGIEWKTYHVNDGFFAYSCLTELQNGNIAYLYEDEAAHIQYKILTVSADGTLSEINGDNCAFNKPPKKVNKFKILLRKIGFALKLL